MPSVNDYSEDENAKEGGDYASAGEARLGAAAGGSARQVQSTPQHEQAFVPWSRFVSANEDVAKREAGKLNAQVAGDVERAKQGGIAATDAFNNQVASNYERNSVPSDKPDAKGPGSQQNKPGASASSAFGFGKSPDDVGVTQSPMEAARTSGQAPTGPLAQATQRQPKLSVNPGGTLGPVKADAKGAPKSLEESMGRDAWGRLVGDTAKAQQEAQALGSETGIQSLLQQQSAGPLVQGGAFDAALLSGAGGPQFKQTAKAGGELGEMLGNETEGAQKSWQRLMGDIDRAKGERDQAAAQQKLFSDAANAGKQSEADAAAAQDRQKKLDEARQQVVSGYTAYQDGGQYVPNPDGSPGGTTDWTNATPRGIGSQQDFLGALSSGDKKAQDSVAPFLEQTGMSADQFSAMAQKMTPAEWKDFWLLGVIPEWAGVEGFGKGIVGGWQSPMIQAVLGYGNDGGMWNAITNMWKDSATTIAEGATGGPGGAVKAGVKAATYKGPGGSK